MNEIESKCTIAILRQCHKLGTERPIVQYRFDINERYSCDFAFRKKRIVVECEGFGHSMPDRYDSDLRKYNLLAIQGWRLIRLKPRQILTGASYEILRATFFPTPNYLSLCMVCLLEIDGATLHTECFENLLDDYTGEIKSYEQLRSKKTVISGRLRDGQHQSEPVLRQIS